MSDVYYVHDLGENENGQYFVTRVLFYVVRPVRGDFFDEHQAFYSLDDAIERLVGSPMDVWVLGEDELPEDVEDIRSRVLITDEKRYGNAPAYVCAIRYPEGQLGYVGVFIAKDKPWYKVCGIRKTDENRKDDETFEYETFDDPEHFTQEPVELYEYIVSEFGEGYDVCVLGKDELKAGMEDIRGRVKNEPDVILAIKYAGDQLWYEGLNQINK